MYIYQKHKKIKVNQWLGSVLEIYYLALCLKFWSWLTKEDICIQRKEEWRKRPTKKHLVQRKFDKQKSSSTYRQTYRVLSYHDTKTGEAWTSKVKVWVRWQLCPSIMVSLNKWTPKRTCLDVQVFPLCCQDMLTISD